MEIKRIEDILKLDKLNSEYEFYKALSFYKQLKLKIKYNPKLKNELLPTKKKLFNLFDNYDRWKEPVDDKLIEESDAAEKLVEYEEEILKLEELRIKKLKKIYGNL